MTSRRARNRRDKRIESLELAHEEPEIVTKQGERLDLRKPWPLKPQPEPKSKEQR